MRAHPLLVVIIAIVGMAAAVAYAKSRAAAYEATAQVLVTPVNGGGPYIGLPVVTETANDPSRNMQTAISLLKSPGAAVASARSLSPRLNAQSVQRDISIQPIGESNLLGITAKSTDAKFAAAIANTYARTALRLHSATLANEASNEISQLRERQHQLGASGIAQIASELAALSSVAAGRDPNFALLQNATVPTSASGTSTKLIALLGLLAGLVIGVGAATAVDFLNRRIRDEENALLIYPLPVLSRIPELPRASREASSFSLLPPRVREVFRSLHVQFASRPQGGAHVVVFTSASERDGKTTAAVDFSLVLATAGLRTILIDFDLRKPDVARRLGMRAAARDLAYSDEPLEDLVVGAPSCEGLGVLAANPLQDLTTLESAERRLPVLIDEARAIADFVVVDTPPLGRVSDALRAISVGDRSVLVVRAGNTDREELRRTRELLERLALTPTGMLVIGGTERSDAYGSYGALDVDAPSPSPDLATGKPAPERNGAGHTGAGSVGALTGGSSRSGSRSRSARRSDG
ncbi:MAG: polysaccharide biosynthesis tyrosine autokinase [Solirubrobacteraceae bacterium]